MALIVQKYGGTSVGSVELIQRVAEKVAAVRARGDHIAVVVSAMSGVTDGLIKMAKEIMPLPSEREMDMLLATGEQTTIALSAIALHALGVHERTSGARLPADGGRHHVTISTPRTRRIRTKIEPAINTTTVTTAIAGEKTGSPLSGF